MLTRESFASSTSERRDTRGSVQNHSHTPSRSSCHCRNNGSRGSDDNNNNNTMKAYSLCRSNNHGSRSNTTGTYCRKGNNNDDANTTAYSASLFSLSRGALFLLTAALVLSLASQVTSSPGVASRDSNTATTTTTTTQRKAFPAKDVHQVVTDLFRKRKLVQWTRMVDGWEKKGKGAGEREGAQRGRKKRAVQGEEGVVVEEQEPLLSAEQEDHLWTFIGEMMSCQNIPGLSLGLVKNGARQGLGFGVGNMDTVQPVDGDTLFGIGSNTKAFSAYAMKRLAYKLPYPKRLSFDTPLEEVLEDFVVPDEPCAEKITLDDVFGMRTGLGSADLGLFAGFPVNMTAGDMCRRLKYLPRMTEFRANWYYSNTMLVVVTRLCEVLGGQRWEDVVRDTILTPLGMNRTGALPAALDGENVALPYILRMNEDDMFVEQDRRLFDLHPLEAAGAIMSSANDMSRWMSHLLDLIKRPKDYEQTLVKAIFGDKILLPAYYRQYTLQTEPVEIVHIGYAMGFMSSYYKGGIVHWHSGDLHGYQSYFALAPDMETGVYVGVNGPNGAATARALTHVTYYALELLQGREPWVNVTLACPEREEGEGDGGHDYDYDNTTPATQEAEPAAPELKLPVTDYTGVYSHGLLGDIRVLAQEERNSPLRLEMGRYLVVDLIPTTLAFNFKGSARLPISDTKDWENPRSIQFRSNAPYVPKPTSACANQKDGDKNATCSEEVEEVVRPPYDELRVSWQLETLIFVRDATFDTDDVTPGEGEKGEGEGGEEGGEKGEGEGNGDGDNDVSQVLPNVGNAGSRAVTLSSYSAFSVVVMVMLALSLSSSSAVSNC